MGTTKLRIAVVGAGRIGRRHIDLVQASRRSTLAAIVDPAPESARLAADLGVPWHADLADLLQGAAPDGIILATPNQVHVGQAMECLRAAVPVLVEKPIATSVADGERLAAAAKESGVAVLVGHHRRHSPALERARVAVRAGAIGDLVAVSGTVLFFKPDDYFTSAPWRRLPGGGPILINLIHAIDDLRHLCGEIVTVYARISSARRNFEVEDTVAVSLGFDGGALGTILMSDTAASPWSWEQTAGEDAMFFSYPGEDSYRLIGTRGSLAVPSMRLWAGDGSPSWQKGMTTRVLRVHRSDPMERQLAHFEAVVRAQAEPLVSAADATRTLRATLAVTTSAAQGREIRLDDQVG